MGSVVSILKDLKKVIIGKNCKSTCCINNDNSITYTKCFYCQSKLKIEEKKADTG